MSAESILYGSLTASAGVAVLVGADSAARIYPDAMPEDGTYPVIVFSRTGTEPIVTIDGMRHGEFVTMQMQCWANTRAASDAVADAVESALIAAGDVPQERAGAYDPETGLFVSSLAVTLFV